MTSPSFAGSIPDNYQRYLVPMLFDDYARELSSGVTAPSGGAVLETACGTGVVTRLLRAALPAGIRLVATDVNESMLSIAKREGAGPAGAAIEWAVVDATSLPFADAEFDAVVCQFGVMFFPDRVRGYAEARRVLRPGGRFRFNVWDSLDRNPVGKRIHEIVVSMFPEDPPMFLTVPCGYHDSALIEREVRQAGFERVRVTPSDKPCRAPSAGDAARALGMGSPLAAQLAERGEIGPIVEEIERRLIETYGSGPIEAPMRALIVDATK